MPTLSQRNHSEGISGYNARNVNSKNKVFIFLLAFFLHHLDSYISIKTITIYFSRIILNQITEIIHIHWLILILIQKLFGHFPRQWSKTNTQKERKLGKFDSFTRLSLVWRLLLTNSKGLGTTWWKIKKLQGWVINKYIASNMDVKKITWI